MRARNRNDVSDALQAALEAIRNTPELNTLYIPAGTYIWSGLRIVNWNGDHKKGGKPLFVYTDENALMINRLKECREANEPEYTPPTVRMGMNINTNIRMPNHLGTQL